MPVGVAISGAFSAVFIYRASFIVERERYFSLADDAMVSMRYGRMLAEGHGLVWNAGDRPVEGYSNLLWTLWMSILHWLPLPDRLVPLAVSIGGAVLLAVCICVAVRLTRRLAPENRGAAMMIGALSVALCYPLIFWTLRGMEVGLVAALTLAAVEIAFGLTSNEHCSVARLATVLTFLTLTRPDGVVPALFIAGWTLWQSPPGDRRSRLLVCAAPIAVLAGHTLFRSQYYGSLFPNTYYLKMTGVSLVERLSRGFATMWVGLPFIAGPLAIAMASRRRWREPQSILMIGLPVLLVAYSVYVGGDAWEWMPVTNRYVTPGLPLLSAAAAASICAEATPERKGRRAMPLMLAAALLLTAGPSYHGVVDWIHTAGSHVHDDALMTEVALHVKDTTDENTTVAVVWAGTLPYFSRRPSVDLLGKNDPVIAKSKPSLPFFPGHDRFDYRYSIGVLRPDLVIHLWHPTEETFQLLSALGYEHVFGSVYARSGAVVDRRRLREWGLSVAARISADRRDERQTGTP